MKGINEINTNDIDLKDMNENMGIIYKDKEKPRSDYKCKMIGRSISEGWMGVKEGNWPRPLSRKVEYKEFLTLAFDNKDNHDLENEDLWVITKFSVLGNDYRNDKGEVQTLKYWKVISQWKANNSSSQNITILRVERDKEKELEVFGTVDRVESDISNTELLGILKDRVLKKEIDATCWPGAYWKEDYKKSAMYPVGVRFWIGDTKETDFTIYISESSIFDADDKSVESYKDTKLTDATTQQLQMELEKRNTKNG